MSRSTAHDLQCNEFDLKRLSNGSTNKTWYHPSFNLHERVLRIKFD